LTGAGAGHIGGPTIQTSDRGIGYSLTLPEKMKKLPSSIPHKRANQCRRQDVLPTSSSRQIHPPIEARVSCTHFSNGLYSVYEAWALPALSDTDVATGKTVHQALQENDWRFKFCWAIMEHERSR
jgi:hypothetical protein